MNLKSIRWRLPISYAAIALLAALSLGSIMLLVLNGYYTRQERGYLLGNAQSLEPMIEQALQTQVSPKSLQDMVNNLSFLSQTRIRVLDAHGNSLADSGVPDPNQLVSISNGVASSIVLSGATNISPDTGIGTSTQIPLTPETSQAEGLPGTVTTTSGGNSVVVLSASPYGYSFVPAPSSASGYRRSTQVISLPLSNSLGTLEISKGPAYGQDILRSVILAWAGAGVVAVLLAVLAGWVASRQVTHPLLILTNVTQRMESGDLSNRVNLPEKGSAAEFQTLAHSFNSMAQRVENTISMLRAFVADAAHELHTPLTALHTSLELAADETDATQHSLFLERAQEQSQRLEALVSGLLDLSRIEAAGKLSDAVLLELNPLVQEVSEQFAARAEQAGRDFTLELPVETIRVQVDSSQLRRVLTNLLENALKFTPTGGRITLRLTTRDDQAILSVADTGIGVPPDDLPRLFERFHRGRNASRYPGSGLGLAIVKAMVDAQGGSVRAESEVGAGTSIIVAFPLPTQMDGDECK
jgi:signal transduction histidine kinase